MLETDQYAHVLLFVCPHCGLPLSAACISVKSNLESAQAESFTPHCPCGWSGEIPGAMALKHWVQPWPSPVPVAPGEPGSCDPNALSQAAR
jgi:hypothetical protein